MLAFRFIVRFCSLGLMLLGSSIGTGQDYPIKPIRINTSGAGGGSDFISRQIAQAISGPLGQPVIVENRVSLLATELVAKAPPDGYTLAVQGSVLWILPLLRREASYDPVKDFSPISLVTREVNILAVHPSLPVKSVSQLIGLAKNKPGELNLGTGTAGALQLAAQLFKSMTGTKMAIVPYKNNAEQITALVSGEVQLTILDARLLSPLGKAGKLRPLAVTSAEPTPLVPDLPTVAATGVPGFEAVGMSGIFAPGKTPSAIINRLNQEVVRFLGTARAKETFFKAGADVVASSPEQAMATISAEMARTSKLIKDVGIRIE